MLIKNCSVNLITSLGEIFVFYRYYRYLVEKEKVNMNANQVRPPTLPHLNLTISLWAGHFYTVFTDDGVHSERASNYPRTCQSTVEPGSAGLQRLTLLLGQGCKAPGGVTISKIFSKTVPTQEALNCLIFGLFVFWSHRLFNCAKIYTVLKFPLYVKGYDSTLAITANDNMTHLHLKQERSSIPCGRWEGWMRGCFCNGTVIQASEKNEGTFQMLKCCRNMSSPCKSYGVKTLSVLTLCAAYAFQDIPENSWNFVT